LLDGPIVFEPDGLVGVVRDGEGEEEEHERSDGEHEEEDKVNRRRTSEQRSSPAFSSCSLYS